jgi:hypothetical protein
MTKVVFSQTDRFAQIRTAVTDICVNAAIADDLETDIEDYIDIALPVLEYAFPEVECFGDTDTRRAAKIAAHEAREAAKHLPTLGAQMKHISENIDCSMLLDDILHMVTCDSDEYEYEGNNAMCAIFDKLVA